MSKITVTVPAHLHAGNMDLTGDLGRMYGTAGFTLDLPRTVVTAAASADVSVSGADAANAKRYADAFIKAFDVDGGVCVDVRESIPLHLGMGSQTALALSIGTAVSMLYGVDASLEEMALASGRSDIVALGLNSFRSGGFIVDGGYRKADKGRHIPPLLMRCDIPEDWLFVVCIPKKPVPAILEIKAREDEVLEGLEAMPAEMSDRLSRIMLMGVMPAILEHDIRAFGRNITEFNRRLGGFWDRFQDKQTYCHPIVEEGIGILLDNGAYGACQTCWGPTFYGLVDDLATARDLTGMLGSLLKENGGGDVFYTAGNNLGASVKRW